MREGVFRLASLGALLCTVALSGGCDECRVDADCPSDTTLQRCDIESRRCEVVLPQAAGECESDPDCTGGRRCLAGACHFAPPCLTFDDGSDLLVVAYCKAEGEIAPTRVTVTGALSSNECTVEVSLQGEAFAGQTLQLAALAPSEEPQLPARTEVTSGAGSCAEGVYVPGPGALLFEGCVFMDDASGSDGATAVTTTCQLAALREFTSSIGQSEVPCLPGLFECATAGAVCTPVLDDEGIEVATAGARLGACR